MGIFSNKRIEEFPPYSEKFVEGGKNGYIQKKIIPTLLTKKHERWEKRVLRVKNYSHLAKDNSSKVGNLPYAGQKKFPPRVQINKEGGNQHEKS